MKKIARAFLLTALCLAFLVIAPGTAYMEEQTSSGTTTAQPISDGQAAAGDSAGLWAIRLFSEPRAMRLPQDTTSFWFMLPQATVLGDESVLTLNYSVSSTILEDYSSLTLMINDVQIASTRLSAADGEHGSWTVTIPADRLKKDGTLNELRIRSAQRSILGDCADIDNPSNWIIFEDTSELVLDIIAHGKLRLGNALPYFFDQPDSVNATRAEFVLPSVPDENTTGVMFSAAAAIGAQYAAKDTVDFALSAGRSVADMTNRIFIGYGSGSTMPETPAELALPSTLEASHGWLAVSGTGASRSMLVAGADSEGLSKASAFLTSNNISLLSGDRAEVTSAVKNALSAPVMREDGYYTLEDFGYQTTSLEGAFHQETIYTLEQPQAIASGHDSYVEIHFRHSKALLGDSSLLTVYVDNVAISSIQLSASNADGGTIRAAIPADSLQNSAIEVKIECYNYLGKIDCSKDYYDSAWTVIDKDSVVYFAPGSDLILPTLQRFPSFNLPTEEGLPTVLCCIPENASAALMEAAAALACRAGQNSGFASVWAVSTVPEALLSRSESDLFVITDGGQTSIPDEIAEKLYFVPNGNGTFTSSGAIAVVEDALRDKIVIQVIRSPWDYTRKLYFITCPNGMEEVLKAFVSQRSLLNQLNAPAALLDEAGTVTNLTYTQTEAAAKVPVTFDRAVGQVVLKTGIPRIGLIIIAVCILLIIILIILVSSNRHRFIAAKMKMEQLNAEAGRTQHSEKGAVSKEDEGVSWERPEADEDDDE